MTESGKPTKTYVVNMQPVGRRAEVRPGMTLLEAAQSVGVELASLCGGVGVCDSCRVQLVAGELTPLTVEEQSTFSEQELEQGFRLACRAEPFSDVRIDIPPESLTTPQRLQVEGQSAEVRSTRRCERTISRSSRRPSTTCAPIPAASWTH